MKRTGLKHTLLAGAAALGMVMSGAVPAAAEVLPKEDPGMYCTFTTDEKMDSNFYNDVMDQTISQMQPGDEAVFRITVKNEHPQTTDWYMSNDVIYSLEDRSLNAATNGGAYSYTLTYTGNSGLVTLFDSDTIGGDDVVSAAGAGLHEATEDLADWLYMDTLATNQTGLVELHVLLEGETQGNDYQDTLADLEMRFVVELPRSGPTPTTTPVPGTPGNPTGKTVATGDQNTILPYIIIAIAAAAALVIFAVVNIRNRKKEKAAAAMNAADTGEGDES